MIDTFPLTDFFSIEYESDKDGTYFLRNFFREMKFMNF